MAKRMKFAGWSKQTQFVHKELRDIQYSWEKGMHYIHIMLPTAQEILDELPTVIVLWQCEWCMLYNLTVDMWEGEVTYSDRESWETIQRIYIEESVNLTEALAELRLRCKENGYLPSNTDE